MSENSQVRSSDKFILIYKSKELTFNRISLALYLLRLDIQLFGHHRDVVSEGPVLLRLLNFYLIYMLIFIFYGDLREGARQNGSELSYRLRWWVRWDEGFNHLCGCFASHDHFLVMGLTLHWSLSSKKTRQSPEHFSASAPPLVTKILFEFL